MISERSRVVVIQAIIVALLMGVVFLTLLQPENDNPLFGINGPGGTTPNPEYIPTRPDGGAGGGGGGDGGAGGNGGGVMTGPTLGLTGDDGAAGPASPATAGSGPSPSSPADDQYSDTLARLNARLK